MANTPHWSTNKILFLTYWFNKKNSLSCRLWYFIFALSQDTQRERAMPVRFNFKERYFTFLHDDLRKTVRKMEKFQKNLINSKYRLIPWSSG